MTSDFAIMVQGAPFSSQSHYSALRFSQALLAQGHRLVQVFFHGDAALVASSLIVTPSEEMDLTQSWQQLSREHDVNLVVCSAAAIRRGILCQDDAEANDKEQQNLADQFDIGGAASFMAASLSADKTLVFK